jgi:phage terminase small subunit
MSEYKEDRTAYNKLTNKRKAFVDEYVVDCNGKMAAIRAGYSSRTAAKQADQLLNKLDVKEAVKERLKAIAAKNEVKADDVIKELCKLGFANIKDVISWKNGVVTLKNSEDIPDEVMAAVSEISKVDGDIKLKFHSKTKALEMLGRYLVLFTDKHEHTGKGGEPIKVEYDYSKLSEDELKQLIELAKKAGRK